MGRGNVGRDDELRREVEWMLAHQNEAAHFIQAPALEAAARSLASDSDGGPAESALLPQPSVAVTKRPRNVSRKGSRIGFRP